MASTETIQIQVLFTEDTPKGKYVDAIYMSQAEYTATPRATLDTAKLTRINTYKAQAVSTPVILTKADVQTQIDVVDAMKIDLLIQLASAK